MLLPFAHIELRQPSIGITPPARVICAFCLQNGRGVARCFGSYFLLLLSAPFLPHLRRLLNF
jgi:hypothetical protein